MVCSTQLLLFQILTTTGDFIVKVLYHFRNSDVWHVHALFIFGSSAPRIVMVPPISQFIVVPLWYQGLTATVSFRENNLIL